MGIKIALRCFKNSNRAISSDGAHMSFQAKEDYEKSNNDNNRCCFSYFHEQISRLCPVLQIRYQRLTGNDTAERAPSINNGNIVLI